MRDLHKALPGMKVYVLQKDEYDARHIAGVYSSLADAMAYEEGWYKVEDTNFWRNGQAGEQAATISVYELDTEVVG